MTDTREQARTAGEQTALEQRVARLEQQHTALRAAMADELHGIELRIEALEPTEAVEEQPVADPEPLARPWLELTQEQRERVQRHLLADTRRALTTWPPRSHRSAAEAALAATPGLLVDNGALRRQVREADREVAQLKAKLNRLSGVESLQLRSLVTALEQALHVQPGQPVNELLDQVRARLVLYDRLSDPEAYDVSNPDELADTALTARERLANMMGQCPDDEPLAVTSWTTNLE